MPRNRKDVGFTLVELLVVIGIIALLISILLPALNNARRQANIVKCAAALKQIGNGYLLYAQDNKGYWPAARDRVPVDPNQRHSWTDLIAKYMTKTAMTNYTDIAALRRNSVIWGCPEWTRSNDFDANPVNGAGDAENVYTGYAMQYYPTYYEDGKISGLAHSISADDGSGKYTQSPAYIKAAIWQRRGSAARGLIADSRFDVLALSNNAFAGPTSGGPFGGGSTVGTWYWPIAPGVIKTDGSVSNYIAVDARHMKGINYKQSLNSKPINMLFCDMHVTSVSPKEAHSAIRYSAIKQLQ
jgi:prepilin-type N-terminal cleavage/methylation domain-containing protein